jgi:hypothetical protein
MLRVVAEPPEDHRIRAGTTTEALVENVRDAPAIIRRYLPFSLAVAVVVGGFIWWVTDDVVAGLVGLVGLFFVGLVLGWQLEPFLPRDRQVIRPRRR